MFLLLNHLLTVLFYHSLSCASASSWYYIVRLYLFFQKTSSLKHIKFIILLLSAYDFFFPFWHLHLLSNLFHVLVIFMCHRSYIALIQLLQGKKSHSYAGDLFCYLVWVLWLHASRKIYFLFRANLFYITKK